MTPTEEIIAAAQHLRETARSATLVHQDLVIPIASLLEQLAGAMRMDNAEERDFPDHIPTYQRMVVDHIGEGRFDWTWALATARAILTPKDPT